MADPWLFDRFIEGARIGETRLELDAAVAADWAIVSGEAAPAPGAPCPRGLLVAAMMRGYTRIVAPRPPGNVHAGQSLTFGPAPTIGATLAIEVVCASKELRNGRRWLGFDVRLEGAGGLHLTGLMRLLWAA